jgi:hypothetical protein
LKGHLEKHFRLGKADLATAFVLRSLGLAETGGTAAVVTPQNWLFLTTYKKLRETLLAEKSWNMVARLGTNAFQDMNWWAATTSLIAVTDTPPDGWTMCGIDVSGDKDQQVKAARLANKEPTPIEFVRQLDQLHNPDAAIKLRPPAQGPLLGDYATCFQGVSTEDNLRFSVKFWEVLPSDVFMRFQSAPEEDGICGGCESLVRSELLTDSFEQGTVRGRAAWGKCGIAMSQTGRLRFVRYQGDAFTNTTPVLVPKSQDLLPAIWAFAESGELERRVREANQKVSIDNGYVGKIPFDVAHWQAVAAERYPNGLPPPNSDDPMQWLFKGDIATSTAPLQVAVARLLGYRWPEQPETPDAIDALADRDGVVCLSSVRGEPGAGERLGEVLRTAYRRPHAREGMHHDERDGYGGVHQLLTAAGCKPGTTLDDWLRNSFFEQHCRLFHQRPFVWHIWDGRKDGFSCLVNYHKLNHKMLENLTYSYLGDWIKAQAADTKAGKVGADLRLAAAQALQEKLKLILAGEPPYDIFVRWKSLSEQSIGWNPDLNDGVRMNIRPFVQANILRKPPNIKWTKDRGKEPERDTEEYPWFWRDGQFTGDRVNDVHLTNAQKQAAKNRQNHESDE